MNTEWYQCVNAHKFPRHEADWLEMRSWEDYPDYVVEVEGHTMRCPQCLSEQVEKFIPCSLCEEAGLAPREAVEDDLCREHIEQIDNPLGVDMHRMAKL